MNDSDLRSVIATGDFTRESGFVAMRQLLREEPEIDAVFAASDLRAPGTLQALRPGAGEPVDSPVLFPPNGCSARRPGKQIVARALSYSHHFRLQVIRFRGAVAIQEPSNKP
ncbi:hypothetical protein [Actinocorallia lasiicapitis]